MPNCKHGEFDLREGCPQCIAERVNPPPPPTIVKIRYFSQTTGELSPREYTYFTVDPLCLGDIVMVPVRDTVTKAKVSTVNVPETEIQAYRDSVKTIPSGAIVKEESGGFVLDDKIVDPDLAFGNPLEAEVIYGPTHPELNTAVVNIRPSSDVTIRALYEEALAIRRHAEARVITVPEDLKSATDDLVEIAKIKKAIEAKKREYQDPIRQYADDIREAFSTFLDPIIAADKIIRDKVLSYKKEEQRRAFEAHRIKCEQEELARRAAAIGEKFEPVTVPEVKEAPARIQTDLGESGQRLIWKWELIDFDLVPNHYKVLNNGAISLAVKSSKGSLEIPGLRIFQDAVLTVEAGR